MIDFIKGKIDLLTPTSVTVETSGGVGYMINITLPAFTALEPSAGTSDPVRLWIHESIREDAWTLYGFLNNDEREMFRLLVGVSGVGAATARMILSAIPLAELSAVISGGDSKRLKAVKGVGAKTADRIIVDLRDKIKADSLISETPAVADTDTFEEAQAALVMLGFTAASVKKVLTRLYREQPSLKVDQAIRKALQML
ncbi:MAG: Holliday junction branch migration protein RuvA [Muribaculaceae bacterium]|nr:Holliday junction branch migration protein RuvA [Muribaculaceae bacterium]